LGGVFCDLESHRPPQRIQTFELRSNGAVISKDIKLPLQGVDVQLFAEALVSIAHLMYRHEPTLLVENAADKAVRQIFSAHKLQPRQNAEVEGHLLKSTRVDYLIEGKRTLAVQVINRREHLLDYMERWAFRWDDLKKRNNRLMTGMVYNPENQQWDPTSLRIGREVCDVFCRYDEAATLDAALTKIRA
jgi:hypothetical protein